jgi:hypothetical protein
MTCTNTLIQVFRNSANKGLLNTDTSAYLNYLNSNLFTSFIKVPIKYKKGEVVFIPSFLGGEIIEVINRISRNMPESDNDNPITYEIIDNLFVHNTTPFRGIDPNIREGINKHICKRITHYKTDKFDFYVGYGIIFDEFLTPVAMTGWDYKILDNIGIDYQDSFNVPKLIIDPKVFTHKNYLSRYIVNHLIPDIIGKKVFVNSVYPVDVQIQNLRNYVKLPLIEPENDPELTERYIRGALIRAMEEDECF